VNSVCIIGRLGKDPEVRFSKGGTASSAIRVCHSSKKKQSDGTYADHPVWITVKLFEKIAENVAEYLEKGDEIAVEGRLDFEAWEDKDGNKREQHVIVASRVDFLRKKGEGAAAKAAGASRPKGEGKAKSGEETAPASSGAIDDDLPF
jgi:single-strand DNA-binding protein